VHQALDTRLEPDERAELGDPADRAADGRPDVIFVGGPLPRALDQVAGREADLPGLVVDLLDDDANLLPLLEDVGRIRHPLPGELADVHESLDAVADVNEGPEFTDAAHDAVELRPRLQRLQEFRLGVGRLPLDHGPPREHEPSGLGNEFRDQALQRLADEFLEVFDPPRAHEARRHEATEPRDLALEASLVGRRDLGLDDHPCLEL